MPAMLSKQFISLSLLSTLWMLILLLAGTIPAEAATWYVKPGGTGTGTSWADVGGKIQTTIDSASVGDEIWVTKGTYNEAITMNGNLAIYGGFAGTETEREQRDWAVNTTKIIKNRVISINAQGIMIDGITISIGNNLNGGGVYFSRVISVTISNCTISGNSAQQYGGGLYCFYSSPTLTNCTITGNVAVYGGGEYCSNSSPILTNCTITGNSADYGGGNPSAT